MKMKTLKLVLKNIAVSAAAVSLILSSFNLDVIAVNDLESDLLHGLENRVRSDAITGLTERSQKESSERLADSGESDADQNKEVSSGDAEAEEVIEIVYENIDINSLADFVEFSKNCKSDSWSTNKIVTLQEDIDISNSKYGMIPYFDGIFKGNNHEIRGYSNINDSYITGLFRYVGVNGMVQDLKVTGDIRMSDELKYTGGICGMNLGIIKNCTYSGLIEGNNTVGAIAAINENTGLINYCVNDAHVSGYYFTGGIVGKNYGVVSGSTNNANINDNEEWVIKDDEKGESLIQSIASNEGEERIIRSGTDTGGIAGYSKGSIVHCSNKGNIGYAHAGYNIGGIVGRQMGIVSYSTNTGKINGRKDIGGIVGQMEPYLEPEDLQTLPEAADRLHDLVEKTLDDMDGGVDTISSDVTDLTTYANGVVDDGRSLAGELTTSINANVTVANAALERFEYVLENVPGVIDHMESASDKMYYFNNSLARAIEAIDIDDDISGDDRDKIENSENQIYDKLADANEKAQRIQSISNEINDLLYEKDENGDYVFDENGNRKLRVLTEEERNQLNSYLADLQQMTAESGGNVYEMFGDVSNILETYKPYAQSAEDETLGETQNAIAALQDAEGELKEAAKGTRSIIDYLNSQEKLRLTGLSSQWDASLDSLHDNLKGISGSIENINQDGKATSHTLNSNLEAVNDQVNEIYHILSDKLDIIYNEDSAVFTDVSDEEIENAKTGRVDGSLNKGTVKGDINIGGIAGSMAIDDEDPEENAAGNLNVGRGSKYTLKNIICECKNESTVESKKDGAGLIVGYMAQGIVTSCEGYGFAKSTEGNYTGGIAGQSMSIIRDCDSLCLLNGNKYVGGIAGYGTTITGCNAMITWDNEPSERYGSIAGIVNTDSETKRTKLDNVRNNYFVESKIGGIDDISYTKKAEAISYKTLIAQKRIPNDFRHLKVIFEVEDKKLGEQELAYGDSLSNLDFPEGKTREGYFIKWPDVSKIVMEGSYILTGEYVPTNKSIVSESVFGNTGKYVAILGGSYGDDAYIIAELVADPVYETDNPAFEKGAVVYRIQVDEGSYSQTTDRRIRLYNPYNNAEVKIYRDGKWDAVSSKAIGKYLEIELESEEAIFAIVQTTPLLTRILYLVSLVAVVLLVLAIVYAAIKRRVKKNNARNSDKNKIETDEPTSEKNEDLRDERQEEEQDNKPEDKPENKSSKNYSGRGKKKRHRRH
ncbi:hypothetical protein [Butyrivibrio sp. FC2001]|uniref:hypothetical protein n=1 Tax=Butyrivibrio sp. FC2001 TaxID=1280671 RepID=UPI00041FC310|nr:hypothetical protein [Butyrivibrio sp. FC2001]